MKCDGLVPVGKPLLTLEEEDRTRKEVSGVVRTKHKVSAQSHTIPGMYMSQKRPMLLDQDTVAVDSRK